MGQTRARRCKKRISVILCFMTPLMDGTRSNTYRSGILKVKLTRRLAICSKEWKLLNKYMKKENFLKQWTGDDNCAGYNGNQKGGRSIPPWNPKKVHAGNHKKRDAGDWNDHPTGVKTFLLLGPGNSSEECKVLQDYAEKDAPQQPHKEACSGGKEKCGKSVKFDKTPKRRIVWLHLPPQRVEKRARRPKSEPKKSASEDDGALMGFIAWIYRQSMTRTVNPSGSSKNVGKSIWRIKGTLE